MVCVLVTYDYSINARGSSPVCSATVDHIVQLHYLYAQRGNCRTVVCVLVAKNVAIYGQGSLAGIVFNVVGVEGDALIQLVIYDVSSSLFRCGTIGGPAAGFLYQLLAAS